ncbi:MAG: hypothetical protein F7B60_02310 [Desulfurococcales archaeon]|nr:hypothetical protein [Desulfurococcales archaeon]
MNKYIRNSILGIVLVITITSLLMISQGTNAQQEAQTVRVDVGTYPIDLPVIVDGVIYTPSKTGRPVFYWDIGSVHTIRIVEPVYYAAPGARVVFKGWNTGDTGKQLTINVTRTISIIGLYQRQYFIEVTSTYGNPTGSGWYSEGARVNMSVEKIFPLDLGVRAVFKQWTGGITPENPTNFVYAFAPTTIKAQWTIEYYVNLTSNVNASLSGSGWYEKGKVIRINAQDKVNKDDNTQYRFSDWKVVKGNIVLDSPNKRQQLISVNEPVMLEAEYDTYYLVKVLSPYGAPQPPEYYKKGSQILINLESPAEINSGVRKIFVKWNTGSKALPLKITVDKPLTLAAIWKTQYKLVIDSKVPAVSGDGWYDENSKAKITAYESAPSKFGSKYLFKGWQGDYKSLSTTGTVLMDSPKHIVAVWEKSYAGTYVSIIIAVAVILGFYYGYKRFLLPRITKHNEEIEPVE